MSEFWLAVLLTAIVSFFTILADWLTSNLISGARTTRTIQSLQQITQSGLSAIDAIERIRGELEVTRVIRLPPLTFGSDLAAVAISMDVVAIGIYTRKSELFPFFTRFNNGETSWEIPLWIALVGFHAVLLMLSLVLKHHHFMVTAQTSVADRDKISNRTWVGQNIWAVGANSVGFASLLFGILIWINPS